MERKIGETFEFEGKKIEVKEVEKNICSNCFFNGMCIGKRIDICGECYGKWRSDGKNVIFVEMQEQPQKTEAVKERQIGEVFEYEGKKLKVMKAEICCGNCFFYKNSGCTRINRTTGECKSSKRSNNESVVFVEITEEQAEQPQKLNLCEILKNCPKGETFWSPMLGDVKFYDINQSTGNVRVEMENWEVYGINTDGTITICGITSKEIMLYPSREQRDWAKVKYEKKKEKFDPKTLKAFDKVLTKYDGGCWSANLFSHIDEENNKYHGTCSFVCNGSLVKFCIPYNDDTKHLLGTKEEAPEFYKYWED